MDKQAKMTKFIDLTDYTMEGWEGVQFFKLKEAKDYIKRKRLHKRAFIDKDTKSFWWEGGSDWKQTYTIKKINKTSSECKKAIKELLRS